MTRRDWIALPFACPLAAASVSVKDVQTALKLSMAGDASKSLAARLSAERKSPLIDGRSVALIVENPKPVVLTGALARFERIAMRRLPGTTVQVHVMEIEKDQKVPYALEVDGAPLPDPWNPTAVVTMPDYKPPREAGGEFHGETRSLQDGVLVHAPKAVDPLPLMIVLDGPLYTQAALPQIAGAAKQVPPMVLAMAPAGADPHTVLAAVSKEFRLRDDPPARCVMGAAAEGFRAFAAAWKASDVFGRVLAQSAHFPERGFPDTLRNSPTKPIRGFLSAGRNDPVSVVDANHLVWGALRQKAYPIVCREDEGFACIYSWQKLLPAALAQAWAGSP
jgi:hypothetical protein